MAAREMEKHIAELQRKVEAVDFHMEMTANSSSSSSVPPFKLAEALGSHGGRLLTIETEVLPDLAMRLAEAAQQGQDHRARVSALEVAHKTVRGC